MNKILIALSLIVIALSSCVDNHTSTDYLMQALKELGKIESATYSVEEEAWNPGDTVAALVGTRYVESYRNPSDTTIGSSWAIFETEQKTHLEFAYDGKMRAVIYDDIKGIVIDSFNVRKLPFRPILSPFFNYTENIIRYVIENNDSTHVELKDLGEETYVKLTIYEDRQVEFFGRAHYIPKNPYTFNPTSIYELWIDKKSNLPRKVRREMSHSISVSSVSDFEFNKLRLENFVASDYFPKDYEIRQYGQRGKERQPNDLIGKTAPNWTLQTDNQRVISLSDLKSKVLMIQFTSVSCGPCKASIPFLKELSKEYKNSDFDFVAIESTSKNANVLKSYMNRNNFNYKFLLSNSEVLKDYSITSFPIFFILDKDRKTVGVINGYAQKKTDNEIRKLINDLI
jgi:thiol-disulfide isomerase/thioredoxin